MGNNHTLVSRGFRIVLGALAPYIARELGNSIGPDWWQKAVMDILYDEQKRDLPLTGDWGERNTSKDRICPNILTSEY
jgi:hypothetical protein